MAKEFFCSIEGSESSHKDGRGMGQVEIHHCCQPGAKLKREDHSFGQDDAVSGKEVPQ